MSKDFILGDGTCGLAVGIKDGLPTLILKKNSGTGKITQEIWSKDSVIIPEDNDIVISFQNIPSIIVFLNQVQKLKEIYNSTRKSS